MELGGADEVVHADDPTRIAFAGARFDGGLGDIQSFEREAPALSEGATLDSDYVTGCALLMRRAAIELVGLLDESFFLYWEDVDWSCRARQRGYKLLVVPTARIWHRINASASTRPVAALYYSERNLLLFIERWATLWIRSWNRAKVLFRVVALSIRRPTNEESRVRLLAYKDYLFRRFGARRGFFT